MRNNKTIIIGSNGQLGTDLLRCFPDDVVGLTHADLEIANANDVVALMRRVRPSLVLNTAAFLQDRGEVTVVNDEFVTPTWTLSLARQVRRLCDDDSVRYGVVHASSGGQCSWYEFTEEIFRLTGTTSRLKPMSVTASAVDIRRPRYSVLDNRALKDAGADVMERWQDALAGYLKSIES